MTVAMEGARRATGGEIPAFATKIIADNSNAQPQNVSLPQAIAPPLPPAFTPALGEKRFRVGMLTGCVMRVLFGDTNTDTVKVLAANGCEVLVNRRQGCCGALHLHNGEVRKGTELARELIDAFHPFEGLDAIIVNSAGCGSTLKEYGHLFKDDEAYRHKATAFSALVKDVSEFLDTAGWVAPLKPLREEPLVMTYHDACHLAHGQQIREAPRKLLSKIPGVTLMPLKETEICCGSAGIYNLTEPEMATRLQQRKVGNILATGATVVATGNPGCLAWIQSGLKAKGCDIRIAHPISLLSDALDI
jgi:glycolate oxidase iron-sulfur subunit